MSIMYFAHEDEVQARGHCDQCGAEIRGPVVSPKDVKRHWAGELVSDVWPDLSAADRDILIAARAKAESNPFATYLCTPCLRTAA